MDLFEKCQRFTRAREVQAEGFYPYFIPIASSNGTEVEIEGRRLIMIGSNNYLGLTHHPHVRESARRALEQFGTSCSGSRFLNGTLELHEELERRLARFLRREAALCFSTGFQTNLGVISALVGKSDAIICDRENHASIFDGCRLSFGYLRKFRHNDMEELEAQLRNTADVEGRLVVVDGLFSMMGDLANLPRISQLSQNYNARLMVDEAHSIGVMGPNGRGAAEYYGIEDKVDMVVGTFSKSFASLGGFVAGPEPVIHYIKHYARSLIFSASITPSAAAAALAALDIMETEPERRERVLQLADRVRNGLRQMGFRVGETSNSPIVAVLVGDQDRLLRFWKLLFEIGLFTNPVTVPAVPPNMDLIRMSFMASHTDEQIDQVMERFETVGKQLGLLDGNLEGVARRR